MGGPETDRALPEQASSLHVDSIKNWSWLRKHVILAQMCFFGASAGFISAVLIPGTVYIGHDLHTSTQTATYLVAVHVLVLGLGPFVWNILLDARGCRITLLASLALSSASSLGGGYAHSYGPLMVARIFQAIGLSAGYVVPGVVIVDLFLPEQLARKSGLWTQMVSMGAPLGGLIGGPVVQFLGWRWSLWLPAIITAAQLIGVFVSCPETSSPTSLVPLSRASVVRSLWRPFEVAFSLPTVLLVGAAHAVTFGITSVGLATILPLVLSKTYGFGAIGQGGFFGGPLVGILLGELVAGRACDWVMNRERAAAAAAAEGREPRLEKRLVVAIPGAVLAVLGVLLFGVTLQQRRHWIAPCIAFGIGKFGLQLVTTTAKTYCVDCCQRQALPAAAALQLVNVLRQTLSFTVPFWSPRLVARVGYGLGFGIEAIMIGVSCAVGLGLVYILRRF